MSTKIERLKALARMMEINEELTQISIKLDKYLDEMRTLNSKPASREGMERVIVIAEDVNNLRNRSNELREEFTKWENSQEN